MRLNSFLSRTVLGALLLTTCLLGAADFPPVVYVPYDQAPDVAIGNQGVLLPYAQFAKLWEAANPAQPPVERPQPPLGAALTSLALSGKAEGTIVQLELTAGLSALAEGWSRVVLPAELTLSSVSASDKRILLRRGSEGLEVHLPAPGTYTLTATLQAPITTDAAGRHACTLALPPTPAGRLDLLIADAEADVSLAPAIAATTAREAGGTRVRAVLGGAAALMVSWQPPQRATAGDALLLATLETTLTVGERRLRVDTTANLTILRRPVSDIAFTLGEDLTVIGVEGDGIRTWERDGATLRVLLHQPRDGAVSLRLRCERALPAADAGAVRTLSVALPQPSAAARAIGSLLIAAETGLDVQLDAGTSLTQTDLAAADASDGVTPTSAWRFVAPPPPLTLSIARLESELRAQVWQLVRLGSDEDRIALHLDLDVRKAGVFTLDLEVPGTWEAGDVTGLAIDDLRQEPAIGERRRLTLVLRRQLAGLANVVLQFRAPPSIPQSGAAVAELRPGVVRLPSARQVRGVLAIAAPASWALSAVSRSGLGSADAEALRREGPLATLAQGLGEGVDLPLAFQYLTAREHSDLPTLVLAAAPRPRELALHQEELITVADGSLRRRIQWLGEVRHSPLPALRVVLPSSLDERVTFTGAGLAEHVAVSRAEGETTWELRFQTPLLGSLTITAEASESLTALVPGIATPFTVAAVRPLDVTRLAVITAVAHEGSLEVSAQAAGLEPVTAVDLPQRVQAPGLSGGFQGTAAAILELTVTRHDLVRLANGSVLAARYAAALGDDGVARVLGRIDLRTRGRPWLALHLPAGAEILEVAVSGRAARPSRRADGALLIPLGEFTNGQVALVYEQRLLPGRPGLFGTATLELPRLAPGDDAPLPVQRSEVAWYLDDSLAVTGWSGDLMPTTNATPPDDQAGDGLTIAVPLDGTCHRLGRLGDGGSVTVRWWRTGLLHALAVAAAVAALLLGWVARQHPPRFAALALVAAVVLSAAPGVWRRPAAAFAGGSGLAVVIAIVLSLARRRSATSAQPADPWSAP